MKRWDVQTKTSLDGRPQVWTADDAWVHQSGALVLANRDEEIEDGYCVVLALPPGTWISLTLVGEVPE